jgi:ribokinase
VVGSLNIDLVQRVKRFPQAGETVFGGDLHSYPGGKGANQAVAVARLGQAVAMIGQVGADAFAALLLASLRSAGVSTEFVRESPQPTGAATILVAEDGQNSIVVSPGANGTLSPETVCASLAHFSTGSVLLCQLESPLDTVEEALRFAKSRGMITILDPAPAHAACLHWLQHVDYLTPNETEAAYLLGLTSPIVSEEQATRAATQLRQRGAESVLLKLGDRGCFIAAEDTAVLVPAFSVNAVDTTAAGDTFNGAFAVALIEGLPLVAAVRFANAAAALSVTRRGAQSAIPSRGEVDTFRASSVGWPTTR